jgi:hypothetical protein
MPAATLSRPDEKSARKSNPRPLAPQKSAAKPEPKILYQTYFRSVGTRTYAAQVKEASNGNHFITLTEGRRDAKTGQLHKNYVLVFSEDFEQFFKLIADTNAFVREHPVSKEVTDRQARMWERKRKEASADKMPKS